MEQQKLPNTMVALVLGIVSFVACCINGFLGVILAGIALYLANKDLKMAQPNPELYENYGQAKTAKTVAIVALVLSILGAIAFVVAMVIFGGIGGYMEWVQEMQAQQM